MQTRTARTTIRSELRRLKAVTENLTISTQLQFRGFQSPQASMIKAFDCIKGNTVKRGSGAQICMIVKPQYLASDVVAHSIWNI